MIHSNIAAADDGTLIFAGARVDKLVEKYGSPLYLLDEDRIRLRARQYVGAMKRAFGEDCYPCYASKALCFKGIYPILSQEGMGVDVVSGGELYTALKAGFPMDKVYFHGNQKCDWEIALALDSKIGCFIVDNAFELENVSKMARERGMTQKIMLRVTPGIDPHTFDAVNTGKVDSQFGTPIATGQALELTLKALSTQNVELIGFHCHIGSFIFDKTPFIMTADAMFEFMGAVRECTGYLPKCLNIGGGIGVRYVESDPEIDIADCVERVGAEFREMCDKFGCDMPRVILEPGRSIVADAGMTVYRAGAVKEIRGYRNYVIVDGGMSDNPRYALYKSRYTVYNASRMNAAADYLCTVAGRCCESDALIQEHVNIAKPESGDLIAVAVTGAYNYSMASNYNRVARLPIVMLKGGSDRLAVRRETLDDILRCDE